jgi:hypothetical protein
MKLPGTARNAMKLFRTTERIMAAGNGVRPPLRSSGTSALNLKDPKTGFTAITNPLFGIESGIIEITSTPIPILKSV